jgi:hypothetical protein
LSKVVARIADAEAEEDDALDASVIGDEDDEDGDDNDVDLGDDSQSWLTLRELVDYNWNREFKAGGWVNPVEFVRWREEGRPKEWSGGVAGGMVQHLSWRKMAHYIDDGYIKFLERDHRGYVSTFDGIGVATPSYYAYVEWPVTYKEAAGRFYEQIIPALQKLGAPDDVRIVFGFDS